MNLPANTNQNIIQNHYNMFGCAGSQTSEEDNFVQQIQDNFKRNLGYFPVYRNLDFTKTYDACIFDGNKVSKILGYKDFLSYPYSPIVFDIGDYVSWNYGGLDKDPWILVSLDKTKYYDINGYLQRCNADLKWTSGDVVLSWPCAILDVSQRIMTPEYNSDVALQKGYFKAIVQMNDDTLKIAPNYRFLFGVPNHCYAYKVTLVTNYTKTNSIMFDMNIDLTYPQDDLVNGVAYNNSAVINTNPPDNTTQSVISPTINYVLAGETQTYTVFHYVNSVADSTGFDIVTSGVPDGYYTISKESNGFSITCIAPYDNGDLHVVCTNQSDNSTVSIDITLKGLF